jgi:hypothetical protein
MSYGQEDIFQRIKKVLPGRWFGENTPVLDSVLNALAAGWLSQFDLLDYAKLQTRVRSATGSWLDLIARDYFGRRVGRRKAENDTSLRQRILRELLSDRCTREAVHDLLLDLTGKQPIIFEPANPQDTGCYGSPSSPNSGMIGYCVSGGWGSLNSPFQTFIRAFRPTTPGVAMINGWNGPGGGFGVGCNAYISAEMNSSQASDADMYQEVSRISPAGAIVWMSIEP